MRATLAALLALALVAPAAQAATFTVNKTTDDVGDVNPGNGICASPGAGGDLCSLRAAVEESEALDENDVINVPAGTYSLGSDLVYTDAVPAGDTVTINGAGARDHDRRRRRE